MTKAVAYEKTQQEVTLAGRSVRIQSLKRAEEVLGADIGRMPFVQRILLENILRNYDGFSVNDEHLETFLKGHSKEIPFKPARVLMQDFTGVPAVVDLAAMRSAVARAGGDPSIINPKIPVDLIIDHSVQIDYFGTLYAFDRNVELEYKRNRERYQLLKWAEQAFENFRVLPPGMGICHQVNIEYLASVVTARNGEVFPDTMVGTDSHSTMVSGVSVLGWGVGGIEAEAALLDQPIYMLKPPVVGLKLTGRLREGVTTTDLVLTITHRLRQVGVVGKLVEVFGDGLDHLTVQDRATISNMSPEFGCTTTYFPIDERTLEYLRATGRDEDHVRLVEAYAKENLLWRTGREAMEYSEVVEIDMNTIEPTISGPRRPHDKILLREAPASIEGILKDNFGRESRKSATIDVDGETVQLSDASVVIASITSCTNTSNPTVMLGAGLVAKKAVERGLTVRPWVKTSLAPGSRVVTQYLEESGLLEFLEAMRFHVVGYGCTTCIGNSGPLPSAVAEAIDREDLVVASVLSGNRNFEARIHPKIRMNFLASPMLVVAYAIAGRIDIDFENEPLAHDPNGAPVYLRDIWPSMDEIAQYFNLALNPDFYRENYRTAFEGDERWKSLPAPTGQLYEWDPDSTYIQEPPFFDESYAVEPFKDIHDARVLLKLGDTVTTDHISPAGVIPPDSPAGQYLQSRGIPPREFNSFGSRRGNHEVMIRGTFGNIRLRNQLVDREGGWTRHWPDGTETTVFEAAEQYAREGVPLLVLAGKEYGTGSSRDWAAKGTRLLGVRAVIADSFERIHRSNLVGMGVLPLQFMPDENADTLGLKGDEVYEIVGLEGGLRPGQTLRVRVKDNAGRVIKEFDVKLRLDSDVEIEYYKAGGILNYVLDQFLKAQKPQ